MSDNPTYTLTLTPGCIATLVDVYEFILRQPKPATRPATDSAPVAAQVQANG